MLRFVLILIAALGLLSAWAVLTREGQDFLLPRLLERAVGPPVKAPDALEVFVCGAASPLRRAGQAQACVAIRAGGRVFLVDAGAGSAPVLQGSGWDLAELSAVFLTHFHSDHIAALPGMNLNSWVAGRSAPLKIIGPEGGERVVNGLNEAYALDRGYRVAHHGETLLPPALGVLEWQQLESESLDLGDGLTVRFVTVDHDPARPAVAYRFDYRGRSVVVSGDTVVSEALIGLATGVDVLLHDALSMPLITAMAERTGQVGRVRMQKVLLDVTDYHAHADHLANVKERTGARYLVAYHLVPMPANALFERIFERELPSGTVLAQDGLEILLPLESTRVLVQPP